MGSSQSHSPTKIWLILRIINNIMNTMINRAVIYCRKSSEDKSKQILSLQDQLNECQKIVKNENLALAAPPFVEAKTGWKSDVRIEFYKMLDLVKRLSLIHI